MTVVINKTDTKAQIEKKLAKAMTAAKKSKKKKGFNSKKHAGKLKGLYGDPLEYQKRLRDEWER